MSDSDTSWQYPDDSNPFPEFSSPDTPSQPTEILMVSLPDSLDDIDENLLFLTPPEHQRSMSSDERLLGLKKKLKALEDMRAMKKIRVSGTPLGGETEEEIVSLADGAPGNDNVDCVQKVASKSNDEIVGAERRKEKIIARDCDGSGATCGSSDTDHKIGDTNVELRCVISDTGINESEQRQGRCVGEVEVVAEAGVDDGGNVSSVGKRSQDTAELMVACKKTSEGRSNVAESASELVNKENSRGVSEVGAVGREKGLRELLNSLKVIVRSLNNTSDDGEVDFLETAKKRGMTFPRPRWWPPVDDES